jgi:hypothetical protein
LKAWELGEEGGMVEPGLDRHEWESQWQQLDEALRESPEEALPDARDLVQRMLEERDVLGDELVTAQGVDPELVSGFSAASDVTRRVEAGEAVDRGDLDSAVGTLRALYEHLLSERSAP